ncbi:MAG TPA: hypothetical protein VKA34_04375 [Balneolales bacterium]|nr:hypothetical protein [Balneolales bacterium]
MNDQSPNGIKFPESVGNYLFVAVQTSCPVPIAFSDVVWQRGEKDGPYAGKAWSGAHRCISNI